MNKRIIIAYAFAILLFAVLLRPAFLDIDPHNPVIQLVSFLVLLIGLLGAGVYANMGSKETK